MNDTLLKNARTALDALGMSDDRTRRGVVRAVRAVAQLLSGDALRTFEEKVRTLLDQSLPTEARAAKQAGRSA